MDSAQATTSTDSTVTMMKMLRLINGAS